MTAAISATKKAALRAAGGSATATFGEFACLHRDHLGSVRQITSGVDGSKLDQRDYRPFGKQTAATDPTLTTETKGWIGERYDAGAGLQYLNARYYDPEMGLFLQPDWWEVTDAGVGTNRYSYSANDPVNRLDPLGNIWGNETPTSEIVGSPDERAGNPRTSIQEEALDDYEQAKLNGKWDQAFGPGYDGSADPFLCDSECKKQGQLMLQMTLVIGVAALDLLNGPQPDLTMALGTSRASRAATMDMPNNPVPENLARVLDDNVITRQSSTLGRPDADDVFVTATDDIAGLTARQISERLTIPNSPSGFIVHEFPAPLSGIASPIRRENPGFVGRGLTAGGAREFVIKNGVLPRGTVTRKVK